jgi:hypothetical protein
MRGWHRDAVFVATAQTVGAEAARHADGNAPVGIASLQLRHKQTKCRKFRSNEGWPDVAFLDEADLTAPVRLARSETAGLPPPLVGSLDLGEMKEALSVQLLKPVRVVATEPAGTGSGEAVAPSPPRAIKTR